MPDIEGKARDHDDEERSRSQDNLARPTDGRARSDSPYRAIMRVCRRQSPKPRLRA